MKGVLKPCPICGNNNPMITSNEANIQKQIGSITKKEIENMSCKTTNTRNSVGYFIRLDCGNPHCTISMWTLGGWINLKEMWNTRANEKE